MSIPFAFEERINQKFGKGALQRIRSSFSPSYYENMNCEGFMRFALGLVDKPTSNISMDDISKQEYGGMGGLNSQIDYLVDIAESGIPLKAASANVCVYKSVGSERRLVTHVSLFLGSIAGQYWELHQTPGKSPKFSTIPEPPWYDSRLVQAVPVGRTDLAFPAEYWYVKPRV